MPRSKDETEEKESPAEWNPTMPLDDDEDEQAAQARSRAHARYEYLKNSHLARLKKDEDAKEQPKRPEKRKFKVFDNE